MNLTEEQIQSKIAHADRLLQVFENNKHWVIPSYENLVDMYRVSLRVWRKLSATHEESKAANEPKKAHQEDDGLFPEWYDQAVEEHIKPIDEKMERINKLLHYLRYQNYPVYPANEHLFILDSEAKKMRETLKAVKSKKQFELNQQLQESSTGSRTLPSTWYFGYDDNGNIKSFDSSEEQQKESKKRRIQELRLTIVRPDTE